MHNIALETARQQFEGPMAELLANARAAEDQRVQAVVDDAVGRVQQRLPGFDFHAPDFLSYLQHHSLDDRSLDRLAISLEEAALAFNAVEGRRRQAESRKQSDQAFAGIKASHSNFRVGSLDEETTT
jgi:hypothetical protein